ncbi:MAG: hypothetical protein M0P91_09500 [Sulfuricurvum sp.]|jgi:DNA-binding NtrC family response regulator|uniref:hypothetical protein n=1 Tax=Sulfuricurvum sp. TaxID=2025608 RepID=UPI0025EE5816|nr:hypothetical protein [Sulfuricurvum sp.]MCK9373422.1 hypothetical protein [Sulfuricurvum sp.]
MKILIIDRIGFQLQTRKMLLEEESECSVDSASSVGEVFIAFNKGEYDVVIIDHGIENGEVLFHHLLGIDPGQPILVVSDAIHCVISRCEDCVKRHTIRRLYNPVAIETIVRTVKGMKLLKCDHYDEETNKIGQ